MPTITQALHRNELVSIELALQMRDGLPRTTELPVFHCPECKGPVRPHAESRPTAKSRTSAHFEHDDRDSACRLSHRERVSTTAGAKRKDRSGRKGGDDHDVEADRDAQAILDILSNVPDQTQCARLIQARMGQGAFRSRVLRIERSCRITGIADPKFLVASHIKPWAVCTNEERLDGYNGLALSPHIDHLFDKGYVTFERGGTLRSSASLQTEIAYAFGIALATYAPRPLTVRQWDFMQYHHQHVFRGSPAVCAGQGRVAHSS